MTTNQQALITALDRMDEMHFILLNLERIMPDLRHTDELGGYTANLSPEWELAKVRIKEMLDKFDKYPGERFDTIEEGILSE